MPMAGVKLFPQNLKSSIDELRWDEIYHTYWNQDEFVVIPHFVSGELLEQLIKEAESLESKLNRNYIPGHKKGGSVSHFVIRENAPSLQAFYQDPSLISFLNRLTGRNLLLSPKHDPHACALYYYTEKGDHIGFHYDTSYYQGSRYTLLLGLVNKSASQLLCRLHTRDKNRQPIELSLSTEPGMLIIFNGDKLYHSVSPSQEGEKRIVFTMEYLTSTRMNSFYRLFSNLKDAFGYFGLRSLFQSYRRR